MSMRSSDPPLHLTALFLTALFSHTPLHLDALFLCVRMVLCHDEVRMPLSTCSGPPIMNHHIEGS